MTVQSAKRVVDIPIDSVNEQVVLLAAIVADRDKREALVNRYPPDYFLVREHAAAWSGLRELVRRKLDYSPAALQSVCGDSVNVRLLTQIEELHPNGPTNLAYHMDAFEWDHARAVAARGPVAALVEAIADPRESPERVRALSRAVATAFEGRHGEYLLSPDALVRSNMTEFAKRVAGHGRYSCGIAGIDDYEDGTPRLIPGTEPGKCTVVTGNSGAGKSTVLGHMVLGMARQERRVCMGAWEMGGESTLELLACLSQEVSRTDMRCGRVTPEQLARVERAMTAISEWVVFLANPFGRKRGEKQSNERNLDVLHGYLADTGCDVFVGDLWGRCLVNTDPQEEQNALFRQQAMAEELHIHCILAAQQRVKDIELRQDKRPTREGIKGSGAWVEIADTILGIHRPALWKRIDDNTLEVFVLKQRYGKWPIGIEFQWDGEYGRMWGAKSIPYDPPGSQGDNTSDEFKINTGRRR